MDQTYIRVCGKWRYEPHFDNVQHIDRKWCTTLIESKYATTKGRLGYRQSFRPLRSNNPTLSGIEMIRTIKRGHIHRTQPGVQGEIACMAALFDPAG
ncbi:MAG: DDE-type integrase/transposase/recombinase [Pseudomonadota bacterium]